MTSTIDHILLIDDDKPTNFLHKIVIDRSGRVKNVTVVDGVEKGLSLLEKIHPDLIFLDINMPALSGWDFLNRFQKMPDELTANIQIFMLTTSSDPLDKERAETFNEVQGFIIKPLTIDLFNQIIDKHVH